MHTQLKTAGADTCLGHLFLCCKQGTAYGRGHRQHGNVSYAAAEGITRKAKGAKGVNQYRWAFTMYCDPTSDE